MAEQENDSTASYVAFVAALISIVAFVWGSGPASLSAVTQQITGSRASKQTDSRWRANERKYAHDSVARALGSDCRAFLTAKVPTKEITYAWMRSVTRQRQRVEVAWHDVSLAVLPPDDAAAFVRMTAEFRSATAYWAAASIDLKNGTIVDHDVNLGRYRAAEGAFAADAIRLGLGTCGLAGGPDWVWS